MESRVNHVTRIERVLRKPSHTYLTHQQRPRTCAYRRSTLTHKAETTQNSLVVHEVLEVPGHHHSDLHELVHKVVGEIDVVSDTTGHTRDVGEEAVHAVLVPAAYTAVEKGLASDLINKNHNKGRFAFLFGDPREKIRLFVSVSKFCNGSRDEW